MLRLNSALLSKARLLAACLLWTFIAACLAAEELISVEVDRSTPAVIVGRFVDGKRVLFDRSVRIRGLNEVKDIPRFERLYWAELSPERRMVAIGATSGIRDWVGIFFVNRKELIFAIGINALAARWNDYGNRLALAGFTEGGDGSIWIVNVSSSGPRVNEYRVSVEALFRRRIISTQPTETRPLLPVALRWKGADELEFQLKAKHFNRKEARWLENEERILPQTIIFDTNTGAIR